MNDKNKKAIWALIQSRGDFLSNKLSPHPSHPNGRNPYAHICSLIKLHFGCSYKEVKDERLVELVKFIEGLKD
ncbi:MAG: hypothetical protein CL572_01415 [Alphaproteobacteria bacterium]|nr:hypothetical protein [Alphaproteobacteria bacterium]|tara:strand:- start:271 stop:489 length:219 start_codon:yes stop_codon:yes gene_type:complete